MQSIGSRTATRHDRSTAWQSHTLRGRQRWRGSASWSSLRRAISDTCDATRRAASANRTTFRGPYRRIGNGKRSRAPRRVRAIREIGRNEQRGASREAPRSRSSPHARLCTFLRSPPGLTSASILFGRLLPPTGYRLPPACHFWIRRPSRTTLHLPFFRSSSYPLSKENFCAGPIPEAVWKRSAARNIRTVSPCI